MAADRALRDRNDAEGFGARQRRQHAEILDGIELAIGDLTRLFAPPPGVDEVMSTAAAWSMMALEFIRRG